MERERVFQMIHGFNKTTLLDYPGHLAATIFLGGCNLRCPFCHNSTLVLSPKKQATIPEEDIFTTLKKRQGILEGVCITGGEPTLYSGLEDLIIKIKDLGFLVKLDTNGSNPALIKKLLDNNLLDYIAMDIKNSKEKYPLTTGSPNANLDSISESIDMLLNSSIDYEFRTTVVKEFHESSDFISIGNWIKGAKAYYLQNFQDSAAVIYRGLSSYNISELKEFKSILVPFVEKVSIRGVE